MQIKMIDSLLELYKTKNISKTSERLYLTQQGLSRQIKALEEELDAALFIRTRDGVIPTKLCHRLYPLFLSMEESYGEILRIIAQDKSQLLTQGPMLRIGFANGISHGLDSRFLMVYQEEHPGTLLEICELPGQVCQEKLLHGELDVAVLLIPFDRTGLSCTLLARGYMYAAMHKTHPFGDRTDPLPFEQLAGE